MVEFGVEHVGPFRLRAPDDLGALLAPVWSAPTGEQALHALVQAAAAFEPHIHALARVTEQARDHNPAVAAVVAGRMRLRFEGMRTVVARIAEEGCLAPNWDVDTATAFVWALTAPPSYHLLVVEHGWTADQWARHTYHLLRDALIRHDTPT